MRIAAGAAPHEETAAATALAAHRVKALAGRRVALGFYFTQSAEARGIGQLSAPALSIDAFPPGRDYATRWNGFGGNLAGLAAAAPAAGFLNVLLDTHDDGVVRSVPLVARYEGARARPGYYESLALAVYRLAATSGAAPPPQLVDEMRRPQALQHARREQGTHGHVLRHAQLHPAVGADGAG